MNQYLSDLDTRRFGIITAKADSFAQAALLIARIDASKTI